MFDKKTSGRVLLKLALVVIILVAAAFVIFARLQGTARVKLANRDTAVDAVTGSVSVDAEGGTNKELKSESEGKVIFCEPVIAGVPFKEGEVLVQLDATELKRTIAETKRKYFDGVKRAHATLTGGKPELLANAGKLSDEDRAKLFRDVNPQRKLLAEKFAQVTRMHKNNSVSDEDLRAAERALDDMDLSLHFKALDEKTGEADFKSTLDTLQLSLDRMQIVAPADGEITEAYVWKGELIGRGHVVGKFMSHSRVVTAKISEESFGKVTLGQKANVRLLVSGERNFEATVSKLLPKADDTQRFTAFLDVKVDSPDQLKPGSTGEVTITVAERPNAIVIPRRALYGGDKIWVVKGGRVERRQVKIGFDSAMNVVEILEGVAEGEQVIVDRLDEYHDGQRVRVQIMN